MTTPLQRMGGLSEGEIRALVLANNEELDQRWDARMDKQADRFERRMDLHEKKVDEKFEKVMDGMASLAETVRASGVTQQGWHEDDLAYRAEIKTWRSTQEPQIAEIRGKLDTTITDVQHIRHRMKLISWIIMVSKGATAATRGAIVAAETGKKVYGAIAAVCSSLTVMWIVYRHFWPVIHKYLEKR